MFITPEVLNKHCGVVWGETAKSILLLCWRTKSDLASLHDFSYTFFSYLFPLIGRQLLLVVQSRHHLFGSLCCQTLTSCLCFVLYWSSELIRACVINEQLSYRPGCIKGDLTHTVSPNLMLILSTYRVVLHPSYLQKVFSFIIFIKERYRFTILSEKSRAPGGVPCGRS